MPLGSLYLDEIFLQVDDPTLAAIVAESSCCTRLELNGTLRETLQKLPTRDTASKEVITIEKIRVELNSIGFIIAVQTLLPKIDRQKYAPTLVQTTFRSGMNHIDTLALITKEPEIHEINLGLGQVCQNHTLVQSTVIASNDRIIIDNRAHVWQELKKARKKTVVSSRTRIDNNSSFVIFPLIQ